MLRVISLRMGEKQQIPAYCVAPLIHYQGILRVYELRATSGFGFDQSQYGIVINS